MAVSLLPGAAAHLREPFTILTVENLVQTATSNTEQLAPAFWFQNVNTPADLDRARSLVVASGRFDP